MAKSLWLENVLIVTLLLVFLSAVQRRRSGQKVNEKDVWRGGPLPHQGVGRRLRRNFLISQWRVLVYSKVKNSKVFHCNRKFWKDTFNIIINIIYKTYAFKSANRFASIYSAVRPFVNCLASDARGTCFTTPQCHLNNVFVLFVRLPTATNLQLQWALGRSFSHLQPIHKMSWVSYMCNFPDNRARCVGYGK